MTLYCVRFPVDCDYPEEIVGIYSANSLEELFDLVDEITPASDTEYAVLPSGGIVWGGRGPKVSDLYNFPEGADDCNASVNDGEIEVTEALQFAFTDGLKFRPLLAPDEE